MELWLLLISQYIKMALLDVRVERELLPFYWVQTLRLLSTTKGHLTSIISTIFTSPSHVNHFIIKHHSILSSMENYQLNVILKQSKTVTISLSKNLKAKIGSNHAIISVFTRHSIKWCRSPLLNSTKLKTRQRPISKLTKISCRKLILHFISLKGPEIYILDLCIQDC